MNSPMETSTSSRGERGGLFGRLCDMQERASARLQPFFLLALRILIGYALFLAGKGKLGNLEGVAQFFDGLGIPAAKLSAAAVGSIEMLGGLLLIAGLASRATSLLLTAVLGVALATAHSHEVAVALSEPGTLLGAPPTPYLISVVLIALAGPGRFSADHLIGVRLSRRGQP